MTEGMGNRRKGGGAWRRSVSSVLFFVTPEDPLGQHPLHPSPCTLMEDFPGRKDLPRIPWRNLQSEVSLPPLPLSALFALPGWAFSRSSGGHL